MDLYERILGTVVGQAVGDASGFPFEGWPANKIQPFLDTILKDFIKHPCGLFQPGQYTDDTQMMREILVSIVEKQNLDPEDIAKKFMNLWLDNQIVGQGQSCRESILRLINNECTWMDSGAEEGRAGNGAAMRAAAVGIFNYKDPENLLWNVILVSRITHKDARACAGAVAVAQTIAYNLRESTFKSDKLVRILYNSVTTICEELALYIKELPKLIKMNDDKAIKIIAHMGITDEMKPEFHSITPFVIPTVIISLWSFLKSPLNYFDCVTRTISVGGDVGTAAAITGAFCGSLNGIYAIPDNLIRKINDRGKFGFNFFESVTKKMIQHVFKK
ncbi:MAG: hypothetical protein A2161_15655 [Candidatus Schekmanbacteria bacterium RBG_13_48_7]|uniref:ADP-ribosylglycohydrolase n=1 Tax=Candidatus Schekmanbacteria bacterium RBG_13_48_7 TaxID=1817878 RepID=A0A1F7RMG0_9BACT|nr:MAG: hypothetical protein A2161_15655 [Candidatus Schekmanbacteria bacterium RBG_13_48_7]